MAAPDLTAIMRAVEVPLVAIGLRAFDGDQISPPAVIVGVPGIDNYHATFLRGRMTLEVSVAVLVGAAYTRTALQELAAYASPVGDKSVINAIEADKTLGGVVEDCIVASFDPQGLEQVGLIEYVGGLFRLKVTALGS